MLEKTHNIDITSITIPRKLPISTTSILLINLLKKEYHFLITTLKAIDYNLSERHNSLNVMMDGLNIKDVQPVIMDSNIDIEEDDEDDEQEGGISLF